jgi:hypothetical protein
LVSQASKLERAYTDLLADDGAAVLRTALSPENLRALESALSGLPADRAGVRLHAVRDLMPFLIRTGQIGRIAASILGSECNPVRAILFDKSPATNWSLPWHQDRTIAVKERVEVSGFGPWTIKNGLLHVEPPYDLLAGMLTVRVHISSVPACNAPLLVAPGSHKLGRIPEREISSVVNRCGVAACMAEPGDIWLYATPILHASEAAAVPSRRLVLQIDYAVGQLPGGLEWLGI